MEIAFTDQGEGFPLVLLHGYCEDKSLWQGFAAELSARCRVVCIDLPGFGQSPLPPEPLSMEVFAQAVHHVAERLQLPRFVLAGHSLGGYVALAYARQHAPRLAGIGLIHSTAFADTDERKALRLQVANNVRANGSEAFVRALIPGLFAEANRAACAEAIAQLVARAKHIAPEAIAQTALAMRNRPESLDVLRQLPLPFLFVVGKLDASVPFEASLAQCHLPQHSTVLVLGQVGHMGPIEAPAATLHALESFVRYCASA